MPARTTAPYGTWPSPLSAADLAASTVGFADLVTDGDDVLWIQQEARLQGRGAVLRHSPSGGVIQMTPGRLQRPHPRPRLRRRCPGGGPRRRARLQLGRPSGST